ncbi:MAG TPA: SDR family NAD(P)-dependent oxidoreductase [Chloroflexia bacterium]|nr:SDR family NAD(P)-dependent oxidoreductase [Chloroflexia bacterium]
MDSQVTHSMANKRILITGANNGIGKATATALARTGAEIIIVGRNHAKNQAALSEIKAATGNLAVTAFTADLSLLADIRRLAAEVLNRYDRLDVLINNVGGLYSKRQETGEGFEASLAINFLGPFLLTNLLLPILEKSEQGRIVNVNSGSHKLARNVLEDLEAKKWYRGMDIYGRAKLLNLVSFYELGRRLRDSRVTVISVDPGGANTDMQSGITTDAMPPFMRTFFPVYNFVSKKVFTTEKAAVSSVVAATSPELAGASGVYLDSKGKMGRSSKVSYDPALAQKAWELAQQLTGVPGGVGAGGPA